MGRYVRKMQLMLTSMANFSVQTNIVDLDQTALRIHTVCYNDWNNLAEHIWRFAGVLMMAQHCWLSSFLTFQGIGPRFKLFYF